MVTDNQTLRQAMRFGLVGVANTFIGLGTIYALMTWAGLNPFASNLIGYSLALANSFILNKRWTFEDTERSTEQVWRFLVVFAVSYALQMGALWVLIETIRIDAYLAQLLALIVYTAVSFVGNKIFTFSGASSRQFGAFDDDNVF